MPKFYRADLRQVSATPHLPICPLPQSLPYGMVNRSQARSSLDEKRPPRYGMEIIGFAEIPRTAPFTAVKSMEWVTVTVVGNCVDSEDKSRKQQQLDRPRAARGFGVGGGGPHAFLHGLQRCIAILLIQLVDCCLRIPCHETEE